MPFYEPHTNSTASSAAQERLHTHSIVDTKQGPGRITWFEPYKESVFSDEANEVVAAAAALCLC
jgi:hypothetical protein